MLNDAAVPDAVDVLARPRLPPPATSASKSLSIWGTVIAHAAADPFVGAATRQGPCHQRGGRVSGRLDKSGPLYLGANRSWRWHLVVVVPHVVHLITTLVVVGRRTHLLRTTRPAGRRWRRGGRQRQSGTGRGGSHISKAHRPRPLAQLAATRGSTATASAATNGSPTTAATTA